MICCLIHLVASPALGIRNLEYKKKTTKKQINKGWGVVMAGQSPASLSQQVNNIDKKGFSSLLVLYC